MKKTSGKALVIFGVGAVLIASLIRFFQYVTILDHKTGYFNNGAEAAGILIYIVLAVLAALYCVLAVIGKKQQIDAYTMSSDGMGSHATQILGGAYILGSLLSGYGFTRQIADVVTIMGYAISVIMFVTGFVLLLRTVPPAFLGYLGLLMSLLTLIVTIHFYMSDLTVLHHSENLILDLAYMANLASYTLLARFMARLENRRARLKEMIAAGLSLLLSGTHTVSKLMAYMFGGEAAAGMSGIDFNAAAGAVISLGFLITIFFTKKSKDIIYVRDDI